MVPRTNTENRSKQDTRYDTQKTTDSIIPLFLITVFGPHYYVTVGFPAIQQYEYETVLLLSGKTLTVWVLTAAISFSFAVYRLE